MGLTRAEYVQRWHGEISYLNRRVLEGIDRLRAANPDMVIVVMSDHGYGQEMQTTDPETRFANLFAAYTPNAPGLLADAPTPVNLMPRILDRYLGATFPERRDRFFLSSDAADPLNMVELSTPTGP
jgi:arylsulfatase A-like enzyme